MCHPSTQSPNYLNDSSVHSAGSSRASCLAGLGLFVFVCVVSILCRVGRIKVTETSMLTALGGFSHLFDVKIIPYQTADRRENADPAMER